MKTQLKFLTTLLAITFLANCSDDPKPVRNTSVKPTVIVNNQNNKVFPYNLNQNETFNNHLKIFSNKITVTENIVMLNPTKTATTILLTKGVYDLNTFYNIAFDLFINPYKLSLTQENYNYVNSIYNTQKLDAFTKFWGLVDYQKAYYRLSDLSSYLDKTTNRYIWQSGIISNSSGNVFSPAYIFHKILNDNQLAFAKLCYNYGHNCYNSMPSSVYYHTNNNIYNRGYGGNGFLDFSVNLNVGIQKIWEWK